MKVVIIVTWQIGTLLEELGEMNLLDAFDELDPKLKKQIEESDLQTLRLELKKNEYRFVNVGVDLTQEGYDQVKTTHPELMLKRKNYLISDTPEEDADTACILTKYSNVQKLQFTIVTKKFKSNMSLPVSDIAMPIKNQIMTIDCVPIDIERLEHLLS